MDKITQEVLALCQRVKEASRRFSTAGERRRNELLLAIAENLTLKAEDILTANQKDLASAEKNGVPKTMIDRLTLTHERLAGIASAIRDVVALPNPIGKGEVMVRPNGLLIQKMRVPLGVVAMIFEARPNVTVDAAVLCIKSGNAVVLRGGKEAIATNLALVRVMKDTAESLGFSPDIIGLIEETDRASASALMQMRGVVDVLIPRGGKGLIGHVVEHAKVPVIETGAGVCHLYVDKNANLTMAKDIAYNGKISRPSVCNALETLLVHEDVAESFLPMFWDAVKHVPLDIRGCASTCRILPSAISASESDYATEYNDYIMSVKVVASVEEATAHIAKFSTGHSEAIVTENMATADYFMQMVDASAVYLNASTRFTDGGEFGLGAEIGISTQKLHARGPMGLDALTTEKYIVRGQGQVR